MKVKNKLLLFWTFLLLIWPINIFAYSQKIIPGGENVGIEVNSKGVLVVGFYKVNDEFIAKKSGFEIGDRIIKINDQEVNTINEMVSAVENSKTNITFTVDRSGQEKKIKFKEEILEDKTYKTGLYVKDKIVGIGTLTYIDPSTKIFGALGHEILEKTTTEKFEIKDGTIFKSDVTGITQSEDGRAGEKNANYDKSTVYGKIDENTKSGIFGNYITNYDEIDAIEVGTKDDVKIGDATIRTVVENNEVKEYKVKIININKTSNIKNILFEITDEELLNKTGGVVQGMSGSPIIQNNKIVGAVTHVIVNEPKKGYGIFITTMLKEGEN